MSTRRITPTAVEGPSHAPGNDGTDEVDEQRPRDVWVTWALVGTGVAAAWLLALVAGRAELPFGMESRFATWLYVVTFLLSFLGVVGCRMRRGFWGFLITENNVMSASRLQWALWLIAISSTYATLAVLRIRAGSDPGVGLGQGLLLTVAASSAGLVGAQLVNGRKTDGAPDLGKVRGFDSAKAEAQGLLWRNKSSEHARLTDVFEGDELADGASLDASKVQMLLLTLVLVLVFLLTFFNDVGTVGGGTDLPSGLPNVSDGMAGLLGISQAGYLGNKLPRRTPEALP